MQSNNKLCVSYDILCITYTEINTGHKMWNGFQGCPLKLVLWQHSFLYHPFKALSIVFICSPTSFTPSMVEFLPCQWPSVCMRLFLFFVFGFLHCFVWWVSKAVWNITSRLLRHFRMVIPFKNLPLFFKGGLQNLIKRWHTFSIFFKSNLLPPNGT